MDRSVHYVALIHHQGEIIQVLCSMIISTPGLDLTVDWPTLMPSRVPMRWSFKLQGGYLGRSAPCLHWQLNELNRIPFPKLRMLLLSARDLVTQTFRNTADWLHFA